MSVSKLVKAVVGGAALMFVGLCSLGMMMSETSTAASPPGATGQAVPVAQPVDQGRWMIGEEASAMGDRTTVFATLEAENRVANGIGILEHPKLHVRCADNKTAVIFEWPAFVGLFENISVEYKIDDSPIARTRLAPSEGGTAFGYWDGATSIPFLRKIEDAERLVIRASGHDRTSEEAVFEVSGVKAAMDRVGRACGWNSAALRGTSAETPG